MMAVRDFPPDFQSYVAREAFRCYGDLDPRHSVRLRRNVRRNFSVSLPEEDAVRMTEHYTDMYAYAKRGLTQFIRPSTGEYAHSSDIRGEEFRAYIAAQYPAEPPYIVDMLVAYAIYYEYLR